MSDFPESRMYGLGLVSYLAPVTAVQRLQVASRSAVRQEQAGAENLLPSLLAWAWSPALTGSGHSLTHPVPPVQELPLLTCPRLPLGCVQHAPGKLSTWILTLAVC